MEHFSEVVVKRIYFRVWVVLGDLKELRQEDTALMGCCEEEE